jgi:predicted RNA-binding protein YlxR (DUF448 family)
VHPLKMNNRTYMACQDKDKAGNFLRLRQTKGKLVAMHTMKTYWGVEGYMPSRHRGVVGV